MTHSNLVSAILVIFIFVSCKSNSTEIDDKIDEPVEQPSSKVVVNTLTQLRAPDGIAIDKQGILFATSYRDSEVFKIDTDQKITKYMVEQPGAAGMVYDEDGFLYLARYNQGDVVKISSDGKVVDTIAKNLSGPIALDFDEKGNLYINNNLSLEITIVDKSGNQKEFVEHTVANSSSLILDDDENVYLSSYDNGRILKIDAKDRSITTFTNLRVSGVGFVIYSQGNFYATSIRNQRIYRISLDGKSEVIAGTGATGYKDGSGDEAQFNGPNGIVASEDGKTLYVAESGGYIRRITGF